MWNVGGERDEIAGPELDRPGLRADSETTLNYQEVLDDAGVVGLGVTRALGAS